AEPDQCLTLVEDQYPGAVIGPGGGDPVRVLAPDAGPVHLAARQHEPAQIPGDLLRFLLAHRVIAPHATGHCAPRPWAIGHRATGARAVGRHAAIHQAAALSARPAPPAQATDMPPPPPP